MSSERDQIRALAERVARRLSSAEQQRSEGGGERAGAPDGGDIAALRAGLDEMQRRLASIESQIKRDDGDARPAGARDAVRTSPPADAPRRAERDAPAATPTRSLWLSGTYVPATDHPSQERFGIGEAVSEMVDYFEREKSCELEPGGKPCDHCSMCSARGF